MEEQYFSSPNKESFGKYIQAVRLEKGLSLEEVSAATRISVETLMLIESENMEQLLAPVYVMGFLRSISRNIGADGNKAVSLYSHVVNAAKEQGRTARRFHGSGAGMLLGAIIILCLLGGGAYWYFNNLGKISDRWNFWASVPESEKPAVIAEQPGTQSALEGTPSENSPKAEVQEAPPAVEKSQPLSLNVKAIKGTWMKVIADEKPPVEYHLKPGDRLGLEAASRYNLLIGNAAGVQLTLNGKDFPIFGKAGQTVTVQIP
jgi:cytoskeleton protein RodZ